VSQATAAYRQEQDGVARFLAERCTSQVNARVGAAELAEAYKAWAAETSEEPMSAKALKGRLLEHGLIQKTRSAGAFWIGFRLRTPLERATHGGMVGAGGSPEKLSKQRIDLAKVSGNPTLIHHPTMPAQPQPSTEGWRPIPRANTPKAPFARQRDTSAPQASHLPLEPDTEIKSCSLPLFPEAP
jgi:phage/plasmid-associated DNA primase